MRTSRIVVPVLVVGALGLGGCGGSTDAGKASPTTSATATAAAATTTSAAGGAEPATGAGIPCTPDLAVTSTQAPPSDVPFVPGGTTYLAKGPFGTTSLFFESVEADPANLDAVRDQAVKVLVAAGYTPGRSDQEEGSEAEATLTGPHSIAIQVIQLCVGHVRIKYTVTPPATASASPSASAG